MVDTLIDEAVSVGAPAYNAGDIGLCAEIYKVLAERLLDEYRRDLAPKVAVDLEAALRQDQSLADSVRSGGRGSSIDKVAWSYRQAFDAQLDRRPQPSGNQGVAARRIREVVAQTIAQGAPAYNRGDVLGCMNMYAATAQSLLGRDDLDSTARATLNSALQQCQRSADVNANAWALRRALDAAGETNVGNSTVVSSRQSGALSGGGGSLVCDFATGQGIDVRAFVVNDTVMGGRSDSSVKPTSAGMLFQGNVTKRGGGGFASVRFDPGDRASLIAALAKGTGVLVTSSRMRGGSIWKFQLMEGSDGTSWQADFTAPDGGQAGVQRIPFSAMCPTWRGRPQGPPGLTREALQNVRSFGFSMSFLSAEGGNNVGFEDGPFALNIVRVEVY